MSDKEIIELLIARDNRVTQQFFFKNCRPLFYSIINYVFSYKVDYDEFVNEFYVYLIENDAYRLRQYEGRSSIYQWMKTVAIRYFIAKRNRMIDTEPKDSPLMEEGDKESSDAENKTCAKIDIETILERMPNKRFVHVIRRLILEEADFKDVADELNVSIDNLYNIKKRAIASMTQIALNEIGKHEKA